MFPLKFHFRDFRIVCTNQIERPNGNVFRTEKQNYALSKGDIVSFTYQNFSSKSTPVGLDIIRIRNDVSWEDVVKNHVPELPAVLNGTLPFYITIL